MSPSKSAAVLAIAASLVLTAFAAPASAAEPASMSATGAKISSQGKATIYELDVDAHLRTVPPNDRAGFINSPKRIQQMLAHMMLRRNLAIEAREAGLDKDAITQREFELAMEGILMRRRLDQIRDEIQVPDLEPIARERYLVDKEKFRQPEKVTIVHVLLNTKMRSADEAIAQLKAWREEVVSGKTTLEEIAKLHSDDPGAGLNSGVYADSTLETFVKEFADAIRAMKAPGEVSQPVQTEFGYHLIQLKTKTPSRVPPYDEIKTQLVAQAKEKFITDAQRAHIERLQSLPVDASADSVEPLRTRYGELTLPAAKDVAPESEAASAAEQPASAH
jgi:peptidyl-prolyl cis-trans isomerase C